MACNFYEMQISKVAIAFLILYPKGYNLKIAHELTTCILLCRSVYVTLASAVIHHPLCIKNIVNSGFHSTSIYDFCSAEKCSRQQKTCNLVRATLSTHEKNTHNTQNPELIQCKGSLLFITAHLPLNVFNKFYHLRR